VMAGSLELDVVGRLDVVGWRGMETGNGVV
jgi:hypothetical protein